MASLSDKVAIVTGAGQGVGQGIALALASEGAVPRGHSRLSLIPVISSNRPAGSRKRS